MKTKEVYAEIIKDYNKATIKKAIKRSKTNARLQSCSSYFLCCGACNLFCKTLIAITRATMLQPQ
ncbi:MAG: hypothetical protein LBP89_06470 [Helicobacteraceae bacterium]|jgi:hypothetical protein|nr:hypothetical protein [Helicobacteraceae bacterium]